MKENKKKLLVYSDCYIYGGSEKLMAFLLKNQLLNEKYSIFFAYRKHKLYEIGLKNEELLNRRYNFALPVLANETLFNRINDSSIPSFLKKPVKIPFFIFEWFKVYSLWNFIVFVFFLLKVKPEIIHINNGGYPGAKSCNILVVANSITAKAKIIYQVNNQARKSNGIFDFTYDKFIAKKISFFINASFKAKEQLVLQRKFDSEKILVVDNCVPLVPVVNDKSKICAELNISIGNFLITQVGFLSDRKGQQYLIKAVRLLLDLHPVLEDKLSLLLVGNGENEQLLRLMVSNLNLSKNVFLLGYRNNSQDFIAAADIFVLPSVSDEDMPLVLLMALGEGKPIIATDFAGISQVLTTDVNGILVSNNTEVLVKALANEIYRLYENKTLRDELSVNAKISYQKYTPENYGKRLNEIYKSVNAK
ncbi:glycosyltransferase family 4 protein [Flavobacterium sp. DG1-102-2]|uniref:glycosyltransferase family 4 protein n=1 Tax=Flavobacterium sp. DG1-102-2 TaxID=3081663 RepID=UPI002948E224|nr:glycosyltransferase family 4 protein [Flavobacterium sp. DG1-102-2]MDV6168385.1 glycosyltransferase family 4 protein [Flavobacterium sp. DG1-102-2]